MEIVVWKNSESEKNENGMRKLSCFIVLLLLSSYLGILCAICTMISKNYLLQACSRTHTRTDLVIYMRIGRFRKMYDVLHI